MFALICSVCENEIMAWLDIEAKPHGPRTFWIGGPSNLQDIFERLDLPCPVGYCASLNGAAWGGERKELSHGDVIQVRRRIDSLASYPLKVLQSGHQWAQCIIHAIPRAFAGCRRFQLFATNTVAVGEAHRPFSTSG